MADFSHIQRKLAALMLGIAILFAGFCFSAPGAHSEEAKWWALGTFLHPLDDTPVPDAEMNTNQPAWTAFMEGKKDAQSSNHESAVTNFSQAIDLYGPKNPLSVRAYEERAKSQRSRGNNTAAFLSLDAWISVEPEKPEGYWARASLHQDVGDYTKALADYETVTKLAPDLVGAHLNRGAALYKFRRSEQAIEAFEDAIKAAATRFATITDYWKSSGYVNSTPDVVETMLTLLRSDRDMTIAEAHVWLGRTHFRRSRFWAAARSYETAIEVAPENELAYKYRGWLNEKMGHISKARADYKHAASLRSGDAWTIKALKRVR
jgi:tetratricopeptide (TPR) repeat protein